MRVAAAVSVCVAVQAASAVAQPLPGTADDPAELIGIWPAAVDMPLGGLAVRGATEADTVVLVDGFEVPRLQHFGLRSIVPATMVFDGSLSTAPAVSLGRAPTAITIETGSRIQNLAVDVNTFEVAAVARAAGPRANTVLAVRQSVLGPLLDASYVDMQGRSDRRLSARWRSFVSGLWLDESSDRYGVDVDRWYTRGTIGAVYRSPTWQSTVALSFAMERDDRRRETLQHRDVERTHLDTRSEIVRTAGHAAGLTQVQWRLGEQTNIGRHVLDLAWPLESREGSPRPDRERDGHPEGDVAQRFTGTITTPDAALWTSLAANLAPHVRATAGIRADVFGRGGDIATQPRGEILVGLSPSTRVALAAAAYRRVPQQLDELRVQRLNPERTTQVMTRIAHGAGGLVLQTSAYYLERSRLVIRDPQGGLRNTGVGTAYGVELSARLQRKRWLAWVTASLSRSRRRDVLAAPERLSELDQPIRADALVSYLAGRWRFGARVQVASGLPVTSFQQTIYDADRDLYEPILGRPYDERLPFRYELDLRVDRSMRVAPRVRLHAFCDVQLSPSTLGYHYSFDYKQRSAVTLPVVPFAGVRGEL